MSAGSAARYGADTFSVYETYGVLKKFRGDEKTMSESLHLGAGRVNEEPARCCRLRRWMETGDKLRDQVNSSTFEDND